MISGFWLLNLVYLQLEALDERFWLSSTFSSKSFEHSQLSQHDHFPLNGQVQIQDTPFFVLSKPTFHTFPAFHVFFETPGGTFNSTWLNDPFFVSDANVGVLLRDRCLGIAAEKSLDQFCGAKMPLWRKKQFLLPDFLGSRNLGGDFWKNTGWERRCFRWWSEIAGFPNYLLESKDFEL